MDTLVAFAALLIGFIPFAISIAIIVTVVWTATKLFPTFGAALDALFDGLMGVDEEYDRKYNTGYAKTDRFDQYL